MSFLSLTCFILYVVSLKGLHFPKEEAIDQFYQLKQALEVLDLHVFRRSIAGSTSYPQVHSYVLELSECWQSN